WTIHKHHGTLTAAPNFAYELCLGKLEDSDIEGLDLGSLRLAFNGAEPVSPDTIERFSKRFSAYGFQRQAMTPVYGLAEASVGLAFPPPGRGPVIDRIRRNTFTRSGRAVPAEANETHVLRFVACGQPIPGHQIRIVDGAGREVAEREEGRLQFSGPSATSGYFRNTEATAELYDGPWLNSGDLAYMAGGEIYLTGRARDIIIRAGRNIYPQEVEDAVGDIPRIRKGCVAVFSSRDEASATERLVILAETREKRPEQLYRLRQRVTEAVVDILGAPPDEVVLAPPNTVLKTSSGKIRRAASREIYEHGKIGAARPGIRWQLLRLGMASILPMLRHAMRTLGALLFAGWAWACFCLLAAFVWLTLLWLPGPGRRRRFVRATARLFLRLVAVPLIVHGQENLPDDETFVLVANHASYLDGMMLTAALPCDLSYVVKRELEEQFIPRVFLHRIGAEFVERFDPQEGAADIAHLANAVRQGRSMVILPEGTFGRAPGLLTFHMGAFVLAARTGTPVVPVAIRGTRSMLRANSWFPRHGIASIIISPPIVPTGSDWTAAVSLRDRARREILQHCGEPDLLHS
ncbi:MAG: AMP-binding protein, partial [Mariprofundaceae bacterium]|nr:AMP-binding protein [Mariprofundaceae bacterium]